MPSIKLTKCVVDAARPTTRDYEIRDTIVPGFLCKITLPLRATGSRLGSMSCPRWARRRSPT